METIKKKAKIYDSIYVTFLKKIIVRHYFVHFYYFVFVCYLFLSVWKNRCYQYRTSADILEVSTFVVVALIGDGEETMRGFLFSSKNPNKKLCDGESGKSTEELEISRLLGGWENTKDDDDDEEEESKNEFNGLLVVGWLVGLEFSWFPKYAFHSSVSNEVGIPQNAVPNGSNCSGCWEEGPGIIPGAANGSIVGVVLFKNEEDVGDEVFVCACWFDKSNAEDERTDEIGTWDVIPGDEEDENNG